MPPPLMKDTRSRLGAVFVMAGLSRSRSSHTTIAERLV
nr:MAG TPA: hypothetical protein [Caudoviricetes sp.]